MQFHIQFKNTKTAMVKMFILRIQGDLHKSAVHITISTPFKRRDTLFPVVTNALIKRRYSFKSFNKHSGALTCIEYCTY